MHPVSYYPLTLALVVEASFFGFGLGAGLVVYRSEYAVTSGK